MVDRSVDVQQTVDVFDVFEGTGLTGTDTTEESP